jgi:RHS repeat-associated protein
MAASVAIVLGTAPSLPAHAAPYRPGTAQREPVVAGHSYRPKPVPTRRTGVPFRGTAPTWPAASTVDVKLVDATGRRLSTPTAAGLLPLSVSGEATAPASVRVDSLDRASTRAAGVDGLLVRLARSDGPTGTAPLTVSIDYRAFRDAYGGDWASRLRLRVLPECALTTPSVPACQGHEIPTANNVVAGTASGRITVDARTTRLVAPPGAMKPDSLRMMTAGGVLVALAAAPGGGGGDYAATSLAPAATWSAGGNTGDFSWSYPVRVPPSLGGPSPSISLNYSSSSVDGRMANANNQSSWIGEGFDWQPGFIERKYGSCADDMGTGANNTVKTGDQCWVTDNASLTLAGHAGELIKDATNPNLWHLRNDDGTTVEHRTAAPNGDDNGEWWVATTTDGTQYWFGGKATTNSTLLMPVFGNHAGEPCHQATFAASSCTQAYRWMVDYVVDLHNNTMTYTYAKETNRYSRNLTTTDAVSYDRAGYLTTIEYGGRVGDTGSAPMRVVFAVSDRCLSNCGTKTAVSWPDVPWDQECAASPCTLSQVAPTFWTTKRLTGITTQVWGGTAYRDVESWTFTQSFPDPVDAIAPGLWLDGISHSGLVGTAATVPDVHFAGVVMPNRVDTNNDQFPAMNHFRIKTITSENGGSLDVTYTPQDCVKVTRVPDPAHLENNTLRCYPVKWTPSGYTAPITDFFHKYLVSDVVESDLTGSSTRVLTHYDYVGDPAWHYTDDDGFITKDNKTWSVWRGYATVQTTRGDVGEQTREERRYFRGMNGDYLPSGTRSVTLPAITVGSVPAAPDEDAYSGMVRETITYNGPGGAEVSASVSEPWQSAPTATRTLNGTTVYARYTNVGATHTRTTLDGNRPARTTTRVTTFDAYGLPTSVDDHGDDAVTGDERCTLTDYVRNTAVNLVSTVSRARDFAVNCAAAVGTGLTDNDVISDSKTSYDGQLWNVSPTVGNVTKTEAMNAYNSGSPTYFTKSSATYDAYGRVLDAYDVRGNKTSTAYTPITGGPLTATTETSPLGWVKSTTYEPAWGLPLSTTDINSRRIDLAYDGLGRLTSVWMAGRDKATQSASIVYSYLVRNNAPTVVTTQRLNPAGGYITSYKLYDSLVRLRQTQDGDQAGGTGAVVTDTYYDSAGRVFKTHDAYLAPVAPSTSLFLPTATIPSQKVMLFDGAGRETTLINQVNAPPASPGGTETSRTTTAYNGDHTDVTPPTGGTSSSTYTDANGRRTELRQYHTGFAPGGTDPTTYDSTRYSYDRKDQLASIIDAAGNHWDYGYDLQGRQVRSVDPDKGTTTTVYNDAGDILSTTDGRSITLAYTYDAVGRKTSLRDGSATGPKRAEWFYDTLSNGTVVNGQLVKTIRYADTGQYIKEFVGFTVDYRPTSVKYTVPTGETGLNGAFSYVYTYNQDGSIATTRLPSMGDLGLETLTRGYSAFGTPTTLNTSLGSTFVTGTDYTSFGEVGATHLRNNAGNQVDIVRTYETDTRRLAQIWTTRQTAPTTVADVRYSYDAEGNVTKVADLTAGDTQCFTTDNLQRLSQAWTPANGDCAPTPTAAALGGPAAYWQSFTYDVTGTRTQLVNHATPAGDQTVTYTPFAGKHELSGTSTVDNTGTRSASYTYDPSGNTLTRPTASAGTQTLTWDNEGHVASSQDTTGVTQYLYDVDGSRLVRRDPTGKTLYLPGQELRYTTASGLKNCTRYYTHNDQIIATRTSAGVVWLSSDQHGTANISIVNVGQAVSIRRETPFGQIRSTLGTWPSAMDKGFVGGTNDNTGLTHLGAREYDPLVGRFVSVDPVIDDMDPQQLHGYAYANNSPVTALDADGRWPSWLNKAVSKVASAVSTAASATVNAVSAGAKWVYDNAGTISTVLSVAAMACSVIPPLQVAAPFLGAAATIVGAIDTYKSCKEGAALDCAMGVASLIPGGRVLGAAEREAKAAKKGMDAAEELEKDASKASKAARPGETCPIPHSFAPETPVVMADGSTKPIGAVVVGDAVKSADPVTGYAVAEPVTALHINHDTELTDVTVSADSFDPVAATVSEGAGGRSTRGPTTVLHTTAHHPFWDATTSTWVDAAKLIPGRSTLTSPVGRHLLVVAVHSFHGGRDMRDLTVDNIHTYYVIAGSTAVLVHNANGCPPGISRQKQDQHVQGTREYQERLNNGTPTSSFASRSEADAYAQHSWDNGTPVPGRPNVRDYEYGQPVGRGPRGGWQTRVRVHMDGTGRIHAHPAGYEYF